MKSTSKRWHGDGLEVGEAILLRSVKWMLRLRAGVTGVRRNPASEVLGKQRGGKDWLIAVAVSFRRRVCRVWLRSETRKTLLLFLVPIPFPIPNIYT